MTGSTILGAEAGFDANGRPVRMRWGAPGGTFTARWRSTWNGPSGVGMNRRIAESRLLPGTT